MPNAYPNSQSYRAKPSWQLKGWHVLAGLLTFFGLIIAANGVFVYLALNTFSGEDVDNAYNRGLAYNDILDDREKQNAQGWTLSFTHDYQAKSETLFLRLSVDGKEGLPQRGLALSGLLRHPTNSHNDQKLTFVEDHGVGYSAQVDKVKPGQWDVIISTGPENMDSTFNAKKRIWLK
jgi:nitrogen fixation protein FixH